MLNNSKSTCTNFDSNTYDLRQNVRNNILFAK